MREHAMSHDEDNLRVFRGFAQVCGLDIDVASITLGTPPQPDIHCLAGGRRHYFELVRAVNEASVRTNVDLHRRAIAEGGAHWFGTRDPFACLKEPLAKKAAKSYMVDGPLHLLLWFDETKDHLAKATPETLMHGVKHILRQYSHQWHCVWLFDPAERAVVARSNDLA